MKSKIVSLSKNSEFLSLLNGNKIANKYSTIFFKKLKNKNYKCLNVSFVAKKKIGNAVIRNKIKIKQWHKMNDEEIIQDLIKIKGIGRWTAEMFLIFTMGRLDVFSFKDIGLLNALKIVYKLDYRPSFEEANLLCNRWSPYKTIASLYLWKIIDGGDLDW